MRLCWCASGRFPGYRVRSAGNAEQVACRASRCFKRPSGSDARSAKRPALSRAGPASETPSCADQIMVVRGRRCARAVARDLLVCKAAPRLPALAPADLLELPVLPPPSKLRPAAAPAAELVASKAAPTQPTALSSSSAVRSQTELCEDGCLLDGEHSVVEAKSSASAERTELRAVRGMLEEDAVQTPADHSVTVGSEIRLAAASPATASDGAPAHDAPAHEAASANASAPAPSLAEPPAAPATPPAAPADASAAPAAAARIVRLVS